MIIVVRTVSVGPLAQSVVLFLGALGGWSCKRCQN